MSHFEIPPQRRSGMRFLAETPSKVVGMCMFDGRLIVACEYGLYYKDADNNFVPMLFDHGEPQP